MKKIIIMIILISNFLYGASLTIKINNKNLLGKVHLFLYKGKQNFLKEQKAYKKINFKLTPNKTTLIIPKLSIGEYAYTVYLDENDNNKLDKNFMHIPKEPTGFSNNFKPKFKPKYDNFKFYLNNDLVQNIDLK